MLENQSIAVVTVPMNEWNETREMIKNIVTKVNEINGTKLQDLMTPAEVCKELKISRATFERMKNQSIFPYQRTKGARKIFVKRTDLHLIMELVNSSRT